MPQVTTIVDCPVHDSFRVQQVAGLFDVPLAERAREAFSAEVPSTDEPWRIGAIVGASGSGKTTIARKAFAGSFYRPTAWPEGAAVIDGFGPSRVSGSNDDLPIKQITHTLTAVGFSSPPAWIKPYAVLSNGEKFRCDLARALLTGGETVVFDEFTSVVDRTVAKIGSAAVAKAIRTDQVKKRFVAVSCHYDILEWLAPEWVVDMSAGRLLRRCLRRPRIELEVFRCRNAAWRLFSRHHYLSGGLHRSAQCFLATWAGEPVAFVAVLPVTGKANYRRVSRIVVLPDFQGVGVGSRVLDAVCGLYRRRGQRIGITTGHPAMIAHLSRSPKWRRLRRHPVGRTGKRRGFRKTGPRDRGSLGRSVVGFRYCGPPGLVPSPNRVTDCRNKVHHGDGVFRGPGHANCGPS